MAERARSAERRHDSECGSAEPRHSQPGRQRSAEAKESVSPTHSCRAYLVALRLHLYSSGVRAAPQLFAQPAPPAVLQQARQARCAIDKCPASGHSRSVRRISDLTALPWSLPAFQAILKPAADHDNVYCEKHNPDIQALKRPLYEQGVLRPPSRSSSVDAVEPSLSGVDDGLSSPVSSQPDAGIGLSPLAVSDDRRSRTEAELRAIYQRLSLSAVVDDAPTPPSSPVSFGRRGRSPVRASPPPSTGTPPASPSASPSAAVASFSFAVPSPRPLARRSQSLLLPPPPLTPLASHSPVARRSVSVGVLLLEPPPLPPAAAAAPPPPPAVPVSASVPPPRSFRALTRVVNTRLYRAPRRLGAAEAQAAQAAAERNRAIRNAARLKRLQAGMRKYGEQQGPWKFDTVMQLMAMTPCAAWDQFSPSPSANRGRPPCHGTIVGDGLTKVSSPIFVLEAHCSECNSRVSLHNLVPTRIAIGHSSMDSIMDMDADVEAQAGARGEAQQDGKDNDQGDDDAKDEVEPVDGGGAARMDVDAGAGLEARAGSVAAGAGSGAGSGSGQAGRQQPQRRRRVAARHVMNPKPQRGVNVQPTVEADHGLSGVTGFYYAATMREVAIYLLCGLRACSVEKLNQLSQSVQMVSHDKKSRARHITTHLREKASIMEVVEERHAKKQARAAAKALAEREKEAAKQATARSKRRQASAGQQQPAASASDVDEQAADVGVEVGEDAGVDVRTDVGVQAGAEAGSGPAPGAARGETGRYKTAAQKRENKPHSILVNSAKLAAVATAGGKENVDPAEGSEKLPSTGRARKRQARGLGADISNGL